MKYIILLTLITFYHLCIVSSDQKIISRSPLRLPKICNKYDSDLSLEEEKKLIEFYGKVKEAIKYQKPEKSCLAKQSAYSKEKVPHNDH